MRTCDNRWGYCACTLVKGHKKVCACQHGVEFPALSDRRNQRKQEIKEDMTYAEELAKEAEKTDGLQ